MSRVRFEEKQTLRESTWIWWIIVPVSASIIISLLYGLYWQLVMGEPWGTEPMSDTGLIIISLISFGILAFVIWILLSVKLETWVDRAGVRYFYYPHMRQPKTIGRSEIREYTVRRLTFMEARRKGYHRSISGRQQQLIIQGRDALVLVLTSGKKIVIGTQQPTELEAAMKKMMSTQETE